MTRLYLVTILAETLLFDKVTFFFYWLYLTIRVLIKQFRQPNLLNIRFLKGKLEWGGNDKYYYTYKSKYFSTLYKWVLILLNILMEKKFFWDIFFSLTIFRMILGNLLSLGIDWVEIVFNMSWDVTIITMIQMIHQGIVLYRDQGMTYFAIMHLEIINQRN